MKVIYLTWNKKEMEPEKKRQHTKKKDRSDHHGTDDRDILDGAVVCTGLHFCNFINYIHAFDNLAKHRVFGVEEVVVDKVDEELAASGVGARVCHGYCTTVVTVVFRELILDRVAGSTHAGARRIASLQHKPVDDPVEDHAIIVVFFYERFEIACSYRHRGIESNGNITHVRLESNGISYWCCHGMQ
jgi:hypothetical protein